MSLPLSHRNIPNLLLCLPLSAVHVPPSTCQPSLTACTLAGTHHAARAPQAPADINAAKRPPACAPAPESGKRAKPAWMTGAAPARAAGACWGSSSATPGFWALGVAGAGAGGGCARPAAPPQVVTSEAVAAHLAACGGASARGIARHFGCSAHPPQGCVLPREVCSLGLGEGPAHRLTKCNRCRRDLVEALKTLVANFEVVRRGPAAGKTDHVDLEDSTVIYSLL